MWGQVSGLRRENIPVITWEEMRKTIREEAGIRVDILTWEGPNMTTTLRIFILICNEYMCNTAIR